MLPTYLRSIYTAPMDLSSNELGWRSSIVGEVVVAVESPLFDSY